MAQQPDIDEVKKATDGGGGYTDTELGVILDSGVTKNALISRIWREKAASYATLVNVSESGSSRSLSDLHKNALTMAEKFDPGDPSVTGFKRTRRARRE